MNYKELKPPERLAYRKKREICEKVKALQEEFDLWLNRSEAGGEFEKHHTQLRAIKAHLSQWSNRVRSVLGANLIRDANGFFASVYNAERLMLSEHRLWEYFRSKFIQRNEEEFRTYLKVADEFAFACYEPIQEIVFSDPVHIKRKEPPLVFFNGGTSPFSLSRGKSFQPEVVLDEALTGKEIEIIRKLPIPVVGIPWNQIKHFPEAVVIAHEVGHIVEDDFGLTERLETLLAEAIIKAKAESRHDAWKSWLGEIFADVYGCLATGPSFAGALIDFLARDYGEISTERKTEKDWGPYPTIYIRGKVLLETLKSIGFKEEAAEYEELWSKFDSKMPKEFAEDIPFLLSKLLDGHLFKEGDADIENRSLRDSFCFSADNQEQTAATVKELKKNFPLSSMEARVLFAAIRVAYDENPKEFIRKGYSRRMLEHFDRKVIGRGIRERRDRELFLGKEQIAQKMADYERSAHQMIDEFLNSN